MSDLPKVRVAGHPLILHKLTLLRSVTTTTDNFRRLLREVSTLLAYEATRDLPVVTTRIQTPLGACDAPELAGKKLCLAAILRAGTGMLDGMLDVIPNARVGHIGLYRDPVTMRPVEYYFKMPDDIAERAVLVIDPMLATGHSAAAAISRVKQLGAASPTMVCLLAAPEGLALLASEHPDVEVVTASVDERLNEHGYIIPGLGDAGDRLFGTR
jgi:uracil phosphoribosyltransferase